MGRQLNKRKGESTITIIVDGDDEKWYMNKVKEHYPCNALKKMSIKPELPVKKKVKELFDLAKTKVEEGYKCIFLIFDLDCVLHKENELATFKSLYLTYRKAKEGKNVGSNSWMKNINIIVNCPCLEYWYLLHFKDTTKYYPNFGSLESDLIKINDLKSYQKSQIYYYGNPDIYQRLERHLEDARKRAKPFDIDSCQSAGFSEMKAIFDYFDKLPK